MIADWDKQCIADWDKQYIGNWDKQCIGNWDKQYTAHWDKQLIGNWDKQHIGYWDVTTRGPGGGASSKPRVHAGGRCSEAEPCQRHGFLACLLYIGQGLRVMQSLSNPPPKKSMAVHLEIM